MATAENAKILTTKPEEKEYQNFICLGIVVNSNGEVLMIKRVKEEVGKDGGKLTWAFPGGKLKVGETREQCVVREVLAETGYAVTPIRQINFRYHPTFPVIISYYRCALAENHPITQTNQPWEIQEIRWVKPQDIKNLITTPLDPKVAAELKLV